MIQNNNLQSLERTLPELREVEIIYSRPIPFANRPVSTSRASYEILWEFCDKRTVDFKESFYVLLLSHNNNPLGISRIGLGSTAGVVVNIKEIFQLALKTNASHIVLCHNHPSGNLKPSAPDKDITNKVRDAGRLLDINLLDHIILTSEGYFSFADEGLI